MGAAVDTARDSLEALRVQLVAAATSVQDVVPSGSEAPPGAGGDVPSSDTADAEPPPAGDFEGWVRALNAAARAAEQGAADAEAAATDAGSWFSRASSCLDAEEQVAAAAADVARLTVGDGRPGYVAGRAGREAYADLVAVMDAAQRRARAACDSIEQPR